MYTQLPIHRYTPPSIYIQYLFIIAYTLSTHHNFKATVPALGKGKAYTLGARGLPSYGEVQLMGAGVGFIISLL